MKIDLLWVIIYLLIAILVFIILLGFHQLSIPHKILEYHHHDYTIYGDYDIGERGEYGKRENNDTNR